MTSAPTDAAHAATLRHEIRRVTVGGALINAAQGAIKIAAGLWGNSQALIADGVHSLSDLATDAAVLIGARFWLRPADKKHPHGYAKIESVITLFIGLALASVAASLAAHGIRELRDFIDGAAIEPPSWIALVAALASIAVKEWLYRWTARVGRRVHSSAVIANAWHHRSDAFSSIPAAIAVAASLLFGPRYAFLDPVGAIVVASLILYAAWKVAWPALATLTDEGLSEDRHAELVAFVLSLPGVRFTHRVRTRLLGRDSVAMDLHLHVDGDLTVREGHRLAHVVRARLRERFPELVDIMIHVEPAVEKPASPL